MFIKLNLDVNSVAIEKTFDSISSLKNNYLSMTMAHKVESISLMDDSEQQPKCLVKLVGYDEQDQLIGLAYICQTFSSLSELYDSLKNKTGLRCEEYVANTDEMLESMFAGKSPADIIRSTLMGNYRWSDTYVRFDGYRNLESVNELPYDVDFDDMYDLYFDENEIDEAEWTALVRFSKNGEFLEAKEFEVNALFFEDAYELVKEEALEYIEEEIGENIDYVIELEFKG